MNPKRTSTRTRRVAALAALASGVATVVVIHVVVGVVGFTNVFEQGPLAITIAFPGGLALGVGVGLTVRGALRRGTPVSALALSIAGGGVTYLAVGGFFGVYADVSASPFRDLALTVGVAFVAAVLAAVAVAHHLRGADGRVRSGAVRSLTAMVAGIVAGFGVAAVVVYRRAVGSSRAGA